MQHHRTRSFLPYVCLSLALLPACNSAQPGTSPDDDVVLEPGTVVTLSLSPSAEADRQKLDAALATVADLDAAGFAERTRVDFEKLGYEPSEALGLDLVQGSTLRLNDAELARLSRDGFVISSQNEFPTFTYGYASIYADDLPLFVSADSILYALHRSYDGTLKAIELQSLVPALGSLLADMHARLNETKKGTFRDDVELFLTVARSLLADAPLADASGTAKSLFEKCQKASGVEDLELFGAKRSIDFSQCKPRGHYTDSPDLERYFRAMMWLGRIDLRLLETQPDGTQIFRRRQLEMAFLLRELLSGEALTRYRGIDDVITAFVGEHDAMTPSQIDSLASDLGITSAADLEGISDERLARAITDGGYGTQRISSHYMVNGTKGKTLPLSASFAFFGQRYVIDSHVFSNVVFDRTKKMRMIPNPLDVAYAALGSDHAGMLLAPEIEKFDYASNLASMRVVVDSESDAFWSQNLYNSWLGALRTLSPGSALVENEDSPLPGIARTEAWGRRLLNTQLASWAELRHDTILYAKQSYSSGVVCEFPDAYVEPYPAFFDAVKSYSDHLVAVLGALPFSAPHGTVDHYEHFSSVAATLGKMAEHQRSGTPHSQEHLDFINEAVTIESICGGAEANGWYPRLFYGADSTEFDPTIADVHTAPEDAGGVRVGNVLHVGTGRARSFVVTVETCSGPRAYAGLASSYYELVTEDFERLTDPKWEVRIQEGTPVEPEWMTPLLDD